jgi:acyl transferase domain-containing protein
MSPRMGKLKEIDKLDSTFFGIVPKVADEVDPQARILLETTYEAICDAGIGLRKYLYKYLLVLNDVHFCDTDFDLVKI